jgi:hypothetical protein
MPHEFKTYGLYSHITRDQSYLPFCTERPIESREVSFQYDDGQIISIRIRDLIRTLCMGIAIGH